MSSTAGSVKVRCKPDSSGKESARSASGLPMTAHTRAWTFSIARNSFLIRRWEIKSWTTTRLPARGASRRESAKEEEEEKRRTCGAASRANLISYRASHLPARGDSPCTCKGWERSVVDLVNAVKDKRYYKKRTDGGRRQAGKFDFAEFRGESKVNRVNFWKISTFSRVSVVLYVLFMHIQKQRSWLCIPPPCMTVR